MAAIYFVIMALVLFQSDNVKMFATALDYIACGSATGIPKPIPQVITIAYTLLMVGAPIVLVVSSIMTLIKSIADSDQEKTVKARNNLFRKAALAVLIFLTASIVRFALDKVASTASDKSTLAKCLNCFVAFNGRDCKKSSSGSETEQGTYNETYSNVAQAGLGTGKPKGTRTILIGDSRTVGICGIDSSAETSVQKCRDVLAIRKGAMGYYWFRDTAVPAVTKQLNEHPQTVYNIVILMGANDCGKIKHHMAESRANSYIDKLEELADGDWKNHSIVFVSVGPIKVEATEYMDRTSLNKFNSTIEKRIKDSKKRNLFWCDIRDKVNWEYGDTVHYSIPNGVKAHYDGVMNYCL